MATAFWLVTGFAFVEIIGAWIGNSLTLAADAGHMVLDATALGMSWYAMRLSERERTDRLTYGYHRYQVLAAFVNGLALLALCAWILIEAFGRLRAPQAIVPLPVLGVAVIGLLVNLLAFRLLHGAKNLAVRSAALHVLGDLLGSVAAIAAALCALWFEWRLADPLLALFVVAVLLRGAWRVLKESASTLLEAAPSHIDVDAVRTTLTAQVAGVQEIHHVHAWELTPQRPLLTLHATIGEAVDGESVIGRIKAVLHEAFGIEHSTVQIERGDCPDEGRRPQASAR